MLFDPERHQDRLGYGQDRYTLWMRDAGLAI